MPLTIVTGGSRGIGAAICRRLAAEGHDIVVGYRTDADAADEVAAAVRSAGRRALTVELDTTDESQVEALFAAAAAAGFSPVTGLVNNAGSASAFGPLADADIAAVRRDIDVDLVGVLICAKHAIRAMSTNGGGSIVNISSASAYLGSPDRYVHYAAAKAGVDAVTVGLSKEVARLGIRVNGVAPGTIYTGFHPEPDRPEVVAPTVPLGRGGQPDEIAGAVAWLLSDDASYATGTTIRVTGGL
ncbi:SDR family NAD(P)-dependent oxidoreductase [Leifsonia poae]|uniref:Oxidoreductase n=1 Tax=Leifsonia poae TaxID=110933 RepID=A0A9W6M0R3_9MICO|nr:SDR family oxidoreductase [Leifsonia poae]GLJ76934.1 oxidoreductase [Leifsonia poae]